MKYSIEEAIKDLCEVDEIIQDGDIRKARSIIAYVVHGLYALKQEKQVEES